MDDRALYELAVKARTFSYSPYSGYCVGAALLAKDGRVFTGCNVENAAYGPSNCAERTAFFKAVSEGATEFEAIAVAGGRKGAAFLDFCPPCGVCRQVMQEFCEPGSFRVIMGNSAGELRALTLGELLPYGFGAENTER